MARKIKRIQRWCSGQTSFFLQKRLLTAISWASGLEQGVYVDSDEYRNGIKKIEDVLQDISMALLGKDCHWNDE